MMLDVDVIDPPATVAPAAPVSPAVVAATVPASPTAAGATTAAAVGSTTSVPASASQSSQGTSWLLIIFLVLLVPWAIILAVFVYTRSRTRGEDEGRRKSGRMSYRARKSHLAEKAEPSQVQTDGAGSSTGGGTDATDSRRTPRGTMSRESRRKREAEGSSA